MAITCTVPSGCLAWSFYPEVSSITSTAIQTLTDFTSYEAGESIASCLSTDSESETPCILILDTNTNMVYTNFTSLSNFYKSNSGYIYMTTLTLRCNNGIYTLSARARAKIIDGTSNKRCSLTCDNWTIPANAGWNAISIEGFNNTTCFSTIGEWPSASYSIRSYIGKNGSNNIYIDSLVNTFKGSTVITDGSSFVTSNIKDMTRCFYGSSITTFNPLVSNSKGVDFSYCFYDCISLISVNLSKFTKVRYITGCFEGCTSLDTIGNPNILPGFASYVAPTDDDFSSSFISLEACFKDCTSLTTAIFPNVGKNAIYAEGMYKGCEALISVPNITITQAYTTNILEYIDIDLSYMFYGCDALTYSPSITINVSHSKNTPNDYDNNINLAYMFGNCQNITTVNQIIITGGNSVVFNKISLYGMFANSGITINPYISITAGFGNMDTDIMILSYLFFNSSIETLNLYDIILNIENCYIEMLSFCRKCASLENILGNLDYSDISNLIRAFSETPNLTGVLTIDSDLSNTNTTSIFDATSSKKGILLTGSSNELDLIADGYDHVFTSIKGNISSLTAVRTDSSGVVSDDGTYCLLTINASFDASAVRYFPTTLLSSITTSTTPASQFTYQWKRNGTPIGNGIPIASSLTLTALFDTQETTGFNFESFLNTSLTLSGTTFSWASASDTVQLTSTSVILDFLPSGLGMGIGAYANREDLTVGLDASFNRNVKLNPIGCLITFDDTNRTITVTGTGDDADLVNAIKNSFSYEDACDILEHEIE